MPTVEERLMEKSGKETTKESLTKTLQPRVTMCIPRTASFEDQYQTVYTMEEIIFTKVVNPNQ